MTKLVKDQDAIWLKGWMLNLDFEDFAEMMFFAYVFNWCKFSGVCFYRRDYLAEWLKGTIPQVEYIVEKLESKGYIYREVITTESGKGVVLKVKENLLGEGE